MLNERGTGASGNIENCQGAGRHKSWVDNEVESVWPRGASIAIIIQSGSSSGGPTAMRIPHAVKGARWTVPWQCRATASPLSHVPTTQGNALDNCVRLFLFSDHIMGILMASTASGYLYHQPLLSDPTKPPGASDPKFRTSLSRLPHP